MAAKNGYAGIDDYAAKTVRLTAHALVRRGALPEQDRSDIEQELMLDLLRRLPQFDPSRATYRTFVARVVAHRAAGLLAASRTEGASIRRATLSLHEEIEDSGGERIERGDALDEDADRRDQRPSARDREEARDLRLDVADVVATLPPELRELCEWLLNHSVTETSRSTATSRGTLWHRMQPIRKGLAAAGLDAYLDARPAGAFRNA